MRRSCLYLILLLIVISCRESTNEQQTSEEKKPVKIVEQKILDSDYYISLPSDYTITESVGPDFVVYYFASEDTTDTERFSGGFYEGYHPMRYTPEKDCQITLQEAQFLGEEIEWTITKCKDTYTIQTYVGEQEEGEMNLIIDAFGMAKSTEELNRLLKAYTTLREER